MDAIALELVQQAAMGDRVERLPKVQVYHIKWTAALQYPTPGIQHIYQVSAAGSLGTKPVLVVR